MKSQYLKLPYSLKIEIMYVIENIFIFCQILYLIVGVPTLLFKTVLRMICKNREYLNSFALIFEHAHFSSLF